MSRRKKRNYQPYLSRRELAQVAWIDGVRFAMGNAILCAAACPNCFDGQSALFAFANELALAATREMVVDEVTS